MTGVEAVLDPGPFSIIVAIFCCAISFLLKSSSGV